MAKTTLGVLIKEARTNAGLTQEQLAKKVPGVTASDISKAERDVAPLTQDALKQIAKITNVTQKSLLDAVKTTKYTSSSKKSGSSTSGKSTSAKTSEQSVKLTAEEKKLLSLYRKADFIKKEIVIKILESDTGSSGSSGGILSSQIGEDALAMLFKGAKELLGK